MNRCVFVVVRSRVWHIHVCLYWKEKLQLHFFFLSADDLGIFENVNTTNIKVEPGYRKLCLVLLLFLGVQSPPVRLPAVTGGWTGVWMSMISCLTPPQQRRRVSVLLGFYHLRSISPFKTPKYSEERGLLLIKICLRLELKAWSGTVRCCSDSGNIFLALHLCFCCCLGLTAWEQTPEMNRIPALPPRMHLIILPRRRI